MLKEPVNDADGLDVVAESGYSRYQTTDAPNDELDLHPGLAGFIQFINHGCIFQAVHFEHHPGTSTSFCVLNFPINAMHKFATTVHRRDHQVLKAPLYRLFFQKTEDVRHFQTQTLIRTQQSMIGI